jgi:CPA1 family monovalent cation:H+ antiporter
VGWRAPELASPSTRLLGFSFWEVLVYLLNAVLFVLVGLQLHPILTGVSGSSAAVLLGQAALVSAVVIAVRIVWGFSVPYLVRALDRRPAQRARRVGARERLVASWSGMRGAVSLAAALALPLETSTGQPFPQRNLIIFVTFGVIFATLVLQGLSLPWLIRRLGLHRDDSEAQEELRGRLRATDAALTRLEELAVQEWTREDTVQRMRGLYQFRRRRLKARAGYLADDGAQDRHWPTSDWSASCWRRSGARSCGSATRARSATRSCTASSATSTWKTPGSRSRARLPGRPLASP